MNCLQRFRIFLIKIDTCNARIMNLLEEFLEIGATFVPYPCFGEQTTHITGLENADAEIDIFSKTHVGESSQFLIYFPSHSHIKTAGIELVQLFLSPANATGGEE